MNKEQFWKDFKSAEHLHTFLIRWAIIIGFVIFVLLIAIRYKTTMECQELVSVYANIESSGYECELPSHTDMWGDPYYIKYENINGLLVVMVYSKNGGYAKRVLRRI